jgi:hypothetical protein
MPDQDGMRRFIAGVRIDDSVAMKASEVYHGTSVELAEQIVDTQSFPPNPLPGRWLGHGTYFFDDHVRALEWAIFLHPGHAAVVRTQIRPRNMLDLTHVSGARSLRRGFQQLAARYAKESRALPENNDTDHLLDCEVIEGVCAALPRPYDSVKAFFPEGEPIYPGSALTMKSQAQIVVRNSRIIVGPTEEFTQVVAAEEPDG